MQALYLWTGDVSAGGQGYRVIATGAKGVMRPLAGIAKAFDQSIELTPARYSAIRARMAALHHVPLGWVAKTLANHKSNTKAALIWFGRGGKNPDAEWYVTGGGDRAYGVLRLLITEGVQEPG